MSALATLSVFWADESGSQLILKAIFGGFCAACAESIDFYRYDDNLIMPIITASLLQLLTTFHVLEYA
jgi:dolichol kinase